MNSSLQHLPAADRRHIAPACRAALFAALTFPLTAVFAQTVATPGQPAATEAPPEKIIEMSKFEVRTTQGRGYVATNSATGMKTNEPLMDIPQAVVVITQDLIKDIGATNSTSIAQYFGLSQFFEGEFFAARGFRINPAYVDGMPSNQSYEDNAYVDTYEVIKGPAQVLYLNASSSGIVLKSTKKPLPFKQHIVTAGFDSNGGWRATVDSTAPLGEVGGVKLGYRFVGVQAGGDNYFDNLKDDRTLLFGALQADFKDTTIRLNWNFQDMMRKNGGEGIVLPSGELHTGAGRRNQNFLPGTMEHWQTNRGTIRVSHRFSDNWENQFTAGVWNQSRFNPISFVSNVNIGNQTKTISARLNDLTQTYWAFINDLQGSYHIGKLKQIDAFGFGWQEFTAENGILPSSAAIGFAPTVLPLNAGTAVLNTLRVPPASAFDRRLFTQQGTRNVVTATNIYWQHTSHIIPERLIAVAGLTWSAIRTASNANIGVIPSVNTVQPFDEYLHRYGLVYRVTNDISIYATESTAFNPPTQGVVLFDGSIPPPQLAKNREIGFKTALFNGRLSTNFAIYELVTTNGLVVGGTRPNGGSFSVPIGVTTQKGFDGDIAFAIKPNWQIVGSFYKGEDLNQLGNPISQSYDDSWSFLTRYDFRKDSSLKGWSFGSSIVRTGGRWLGTAGLSNAPFTADQIRTGVIKLKTGTLVNAFATYQLNRHWTFRASVDNILDEDYVVAAQTALFADPSTPRTFNFRTEYKF